MQNPLRERRSGGFSLATIMESSREVIFDLVDGQPVLHFVGFLIDLGTAELYLGPTFDGIDFNDANDIKKDLAFAHICGVPVVPEQARSCGAARRIRA